MNRRAQLLAEGDQDLGKAKPTLILVPPNLVGQTWNEFNKWTEGLNVMEYYDDTRAKGNATGRPRVDGKLDKNHWIFHNDQQHTDDISKRVIISSLPTWNTRHGPAALKHWRRTVRHIARPRLEGRDLDYDPECPSMLPKMFEMVVVDEAHMLKQEDGHWQHAALWLDPTFTLLVTATPGINSLDDWKGYLPFVQPRNPPTDDLGQPYPAHTNPYVDGGIGDHLPLLRLQSDIFKHNISDNRNETLAGAYVRKFQEVCMVRRTFASKINSHPVSEDLPRIFKYYIDCHYSAEQQAEYQEMADPHLAKLILNLTKPGDPRDRGRIIWNQEYARNLILDSDWLGYEYCNEELLVENIYSLTDKPNWLWWLLQIVRRGRQAADAERAQAAREAGEEPRPERDYFVPAVSDRPDLVGAVCNDSPKYKALLGLVSDWVVRKGEKAVVWTTYPAQQKMVEEILNKVGIKTKALTSNMSTAERESLIDNFNTVQDDIQILVLSYSMSSFGLNLHFLCRHSIHLNMPMSRAIRDQADARFRRIGQTRDVYSWVISTANTFNDRQYTNNISKSVPQIVSELNKRVVHFTTRESAIGSIDVEVRGWVLIDGVLTSSHLVTPEIRNRATVRQATLDHIVAYIQGMEKGATLQFLE